MNKMNLIKEIFLVKSKLFRVTSEVDQMAVP
jgi:hypothetical protein